MIIWYTVPVIWHMTDVVIFNFGLFFALSPPLTLPKNENFKKMKKNLEISSFYISLPKIMIIWNTVPEIWHMTDVIIFHFGLFFALLQSKKIKISKKWKNSWRYYHFTYVHQKLWLDGVQFLRNGAPQTDRQKKWHTEVGVPPNNSRICKFEYRHFAD